MDVYFVRHGETSENRRHIHQHPLVSLSERGREQAATAGEYLRQMNPDLLISSDYARAMETAIIIGGILGIVPKIEPLFHEVTRPSSLQGKSHFHPLSLWYVTRSILTRGNIRSHYKDAESFSDVEERVSEALRYIESCTGTHKSVVIVSHTMFINLLASFMCGSRLRGTVELMRSLFHIANMKNCEVMHVKYMGVTKEGTCAWQLVEKSPAVQKVREVQSA